MSSKREFQNQVMIFRWDQTAAAARRRMERICRLDQKLEEENRCDQIGELERRDKRKDLWPDPLEEIDRLHQLEEADRVGRRFYSGSVLRTVFTFFEGRQIQGSRLELEQTLFDCPGFGFYSPDQILGGFLYLLTLTGEKNIRLTGEKELGLTDGFYRDAWATALTETGRELLQKRLAQQVSSGQISGSFGPGYYGMEADQLPAFLQALDGKRIGAGISKGGALTPPKSCAGFYLWLTETAPPMPDSCKSCKGSGNGCDFCMKKGHR